MSKTLDLLIQCAENFDDVIAIADYQGEDRPLIYVNEHFTTVTGYTADEVIGRNCRFLQGEATDTEVTKSLRESIMSGETCYYDLINYKRDGKVFWNRLILLPIHDEVMGLRYYIGIQTDITEKKEEELGKSLAEALPDMKTGELEHKIKNPLNAILANYRSLPYFTDGSIESEREVRKMIDEISKETKGIIEYVRSL